MTQPILTILCTDARPDFMGEEIMPGYFRVTGSSDPVLQSLITARPEFNVMRVDADCTLVQDDAAPVEFDAADDAPLPVELVEARAEYAQRNDLYMTGMGG
mgnify:FL=1